MMRLMGPGAYAHLPRGRGQTLAQAHWGSFRAGTRPFVASGEERSNRQQHVDRDETEQGPAKDPGPLEIQFSPTVNSRGPHVEGAADGQNHAFEPRRDRSR